MMDQMDDIYFPIQEMITSFLRTEAENRVVQTTELQVYECTSKCIQDITQKTTCHPSKKPCGENCISLFTKSDRLKEKVVKLLQNHSEQFQPVLDMLADNVHIQDSDTDKKQIYDMFISDCKKGSNYQIYIKLILYAIATCTNTPVYILDTNEIGDLQWIYYQPLFSFEDQARHCIHFLTMYMSPVKTFFPINQHDLEGQRKPKASGQIEMYWNILKDTQALQIDVPDILMNLPESNKSDMCRDCDSEVVNTCCEYFKSRDMIDEKMFDSMVTSHRIRAKSVEMFRDIAVQNKPAYIIICKVLIYLRKKSILSRHVQDWKSLVSSCTYLAQFEALEALDNAVYNRNVVVTEFVKSCQVGGREIDERRKRITTTVIASSSTGVASGGLIIAGLALAPSSFGISLGLSIAGGVIGIISGSAAGGARAVEAVKENRKLVDIRSKQNNMRDKERAVAEALRNVEKIFETVIRNDADIEYGNFGGSKRGLMAVGSVFRATHGGIGIGLVAARLAASTAAVSAATIGPLSLVLDIAFLAEAAHNKARGDKTNSGKILKRAAESIETKSKIFNSILRGNCDSDKRMFDNYE